MGRLKNFFKVLAAVFIAIFLATGAVIYYTDSAGTAVDFVLSKLGVRHTVADRLVKYQEPVANRLGRKFVAAGLPYPPAATTFVAFKDKRQLEVYGRSAPGTPWVFVGSYPILAASGKAGPKLREGDEQVPEGVYRVESLNPNSRYHLSIRLNYPNEFDRLMAQAERRSNLGGDIMIHGSSFSVGCLAMGDEAAEDLFVLAALTKPQNASVIISPTDFRTATTHVTLAKPSWSSTLYDALKVELRNYRR